VAPERPAKAGVGAPSGDDGNGPKRFCAQREMAFVARLLCGEPLEPLARKANVSIAKLSHALRRKSANARTVTTISATNYPAPVNSPLRKLTIATADIRLTK
jgi:hypothetical protein